jgi:CRISPR type I-E-associated protein CasB/Cse2
MTPTEVFDKFRYDLGYGDKADRAALARLRRVGPGNTPGELDLLPLLQVPQAVIALRELRAEEGVRLHQAAAALSVLAGIKTARSETVGASLKRGDRMKEARFLRLLRMETPAERLREGRRIVSLLNGEANPGRLGTDLFYWGEQARLSWSLDYHASELHDRDETTDQTA